MNKKNISLVLLIMLFVSCEEYLSVDVPDWSESTHGTVDPNSLQLFSQTSLNTLQISVESDYWEKLVESTSSLVGTFGLSGMQPPPSNNSNELITISAPSPDFVPVTITYNGIKWYKAGFRFKGNSSLHDSWINGIWKVPLKLNFSHFGNIYKKIDQQRFYGYNELSFSSNFKDPSQVREKLAYELMEEFGIPVSKTNFAKIFIDNGSGEKYYGVYTLVEVVEDAMIKRIYGPTIGNCYKPSGMSATLQKGRVNSYELSESITGSTKISDVENLIDVLYSDTRKSKPDEWRQELESIFEVDLFLKYLAANTIIQNWDAYGKSSQNYYLYQIPATKKIVFIPWDLSESFEIQTLYENHKIDQSNVSDNWPLIKFLIADTVYYDRYKRFVKQFNESVFEPQKVANRIDELYNVIKSSILVEKPGYTHNNSTTAISEYINQLKRQIQNRNIEVKKFYQ